MVQCGILVYAIFAAITELGITVELTAATFLILKYFTWRVRQLLPIHIMRN